MTAGFTNVEYNPDVTQDDMVVLAFADILYGAFQNTSISDLKNERAILYVKG